MPAPHRLAQLHALGGDHAKQAEAELRRVLDACAGNVTKAAEMLKVHDKTVHRWLTVWGMRKKS